MLKEFEIIEIFVVQHGHDSAHVFFNSTEIQQDACRISMVAGNIDFNLPVVPMQVLTLFTHHGKLMCGSEFSDDFQLIHSNNFQITMLKDLIDHFGGSAFEDIF